MELEEIINDELAIWLQDVIDNMTAAIDRQNAPNGFTGSKLSASINYRLPAQNEGEIYMNDYWPFFEYGVAGVRNQKRNAGKFRYKTVHPPKTMIDAIAGWIFEHGIRIPQVFYREGESKMDAQMRFATAVAYGVKIKGLEMKPFFNPNFNPETLDALGKRIEKRIVENGLNL